MGLFLYDELQAWHLFLQSRLPKCGWDHPLDGACLVLGCAGCWLLGAGPLALSFILVSFGDRHPLPGLS